jgi:hypothetical protein
MTRRRPLAVELVGAALRELLPLLRRIADAMDPAGTATSAWGPRPKPTEPVCPDVVPDALLVRW